MEMKTLKIKNLILLFLCAVIWGVAFVAQSDGMNYVEPFTFNGVRSVMGAVVLVPVILVNRKFKSAEQKKSEPVKRSIVAGAICGIPLCLASNLQQVGIQYTTVGKAGFITALYIVLVPILGLFFKKKVTWRIWLAVMVAVAGLYLLCINGTFSLAMGDILMIACAFCFSCQILCVDYFVAKCDGVIMSASQFAVSGLISLVLMFIVENPSMPAIMSAWLPLCYAGIMSCGVAYTFQIIGQKGMDPTIASLVMSLESVTSVIAGWLILGQSLSVREGIGCVLMFVAIVLAQI